MRIVTRNRKRNFTMYDKGYRYLIEFENQDIAPLYVKTVTDIAKLTREIYPEEVLSGVFFISCAGDESYSQSDTVAWS